MFIVIISFPPVESGKVLVSKMVYLLRQINHSSVKGFMSRKLLKPTTGGNYAAVVEFENQAAFKAMHSSSIHDKEGEQVKPLFDG